MSNKIEQFEQKVLAGVVDRLDEAHETNAMPCPCCVSNDFVEGQVTAILSDMYEAGKEGKHGELLDKLYSNQVTFAALAFTYENLMEQWQELFEEEFKTDMRNWVSS